MSPPKSSWPSSKIRLKRKLRQSYLLGNGDSPHPQGLLALRALGAGVGPRPRSSRACGSAPLHCELRTLRKHAPKAHFPGGHRRYQTHSGSAEANAAPGLRPLRSAGADHEQDVATPLWVWSGVTSSPVLCGDPQGPVGSLATIRQERRPQEKTTRSFLSKVQVGVVINPGMNSCEEVAM